MSTRLYLDTSALVKLVRAEPESDSLMEVIAHAGTTPVASALVCVELRATVAAATHGGAAAERERVERILEAIDLVAMDDAVLDEAGRLDLPGARLPDAIHVATARLLSGDLAALVTYDRHLLVAAGELGLPVASPGAEATPGPF
ncbi:MAG: type II toxin-antitoxin system VapC family toxin [Thermoleophilia bacterium]